MFIQTRNQTKRGPKSLRYRIMYQEYKLDDTMK